MKTPDCPSCGDWGDFIKEDQWHCDNPNCRVTTFECYGQTGGQQ